MGLNDCKFLLTQRFQRTQGYKKVIREAHRLINRINHILEFRMKRQTDHFICQEIKMFIYIRVKLIAYIISAEEPRCSREDTKFSTYWKKKTLYVQCKFSREGGLDEAPSSVPASSTKQTHSSLYGDINHVKNASRAQVALSG